MTDAGELTYRRVHRASPELLFDCLTTPEHLARFWGPAGTTSPPIASRWTCASAARSSP